MSDVFKVGDRVVSVQFPEYVGTVVCIRDADPTFRFPHLADTVGVMWDDDRSRSVEFLTSAELSAR